MTVRALMIAVVLGTIAQIGNAAPPRGYSIQLIDLAGDTSRQTTVDREPGQYLGHPTTVLLDDGRTMIAVYPKGHGKGAIVMKRSIDGGLTWSERLPVPENWATSQEVPTIYRVVERDGTRRLVMFSGLYPIRMAVSEDEGATWSSLEPIGDFGGIVAMSCLAPMADGTHLAFFHDDGRFIHEGGSATDTMTLYQTRSGDGGLTWSEPEVIHADDDIHLCEAGLIRSPDGRRIAILLRENKRMRNSHVMFSDDEGRTWSAPRELPGALTGDRHTGRYAPDGRLFISFRDTTHDSPTQGDWVGWVGTWDDIVEGREGQYRVRLMDNHHKWDCAYPGVERLADGTFVTTTYGHWTEDEEPYVVTVRFTVDELDTLASPAAEPEFVEGESIVDMVDIDAMRSIFGEDWIRNEALIIESLDDLSELRPEQREDARAFVDRYKGMGVVALGEVSFSKLTAPLNTVNLRIFRFGTPAEAEAWRAQSYESTRGQSQFDKRQKGNRIMYDARGRKKHVVFQDELWLTISQIGKDDLHMRVLDECVTLPAPRAAGK